jgi:hypothetical protein
MCLVWTPVILDKSPIPKLRALTSGPSEQLTDQELGGDTDHHIDRPALSSVDY